MDRAHISFLSYAVWYETKSLAPSCLDNKARTCAQLDTCTEVHFETCSIWQLRLYRNFHIETVACNYEPNRTLRHLELLRSGIQIT